MSWMTFDISEEMDIICRENVMIRVLKGALFVGHRRVGRPQKKWKDNI